MNDDGLYVTAASFLGCVQQQVGQIASIPDHGPLRRRDEDVAPLGFSAFRGLALAGFGRGTS